MGAPIVVNTVKVQGTVTAGGTTPIIGTVSQNATWNVNAAQTGGWTVSVSEAYDVNSGASAPFKIFPMGGSSTAGVWVPLGVDSATGRLLTDTVLSGSVETFTNSIATVTSSEAALQGSTLSTWIGTGSVIPIGVADQTGQTWDYVKTENGGVLVSGTVNVSAYGTSVMPVAGSVTIPSSTPGYVAGTITASASTPAYVAGTVTSNVGSGTRPVTVQGTANTIERGSAIAHGSAAVSTSAQILAASGTRRTAVVTNLGTDYVWLGASGVATGSGLRLAPGQTAVIDRAPQAAIHGVAQSGTQSVAFFTESD